MSPLNSNLSPLTSHPSRLTSHLSPPTPLPPTSHLSPLTLTSHLSPWRSHDDLASLAIYVKLSLISTQPRVTWLPNAQAFTMIKPTRESTTFINDAGTKFAFWFLFGGYRNAKMRINKLYNNDEWLVTNEATQCNSRILFFVCQKNDRRILSLSKNCYIEMRFVTLHCFQKQSQITNDTKSTSHSPSNSNSLCNSHHQSHSHADSQH